MPLMVFIAPTTRLVAIVSVTSLLFLAALGAVRAKPVVPMR